MTEIWAFIGLAGWGFWSAAAMMPARHKATTFCILAGAVLLNGSLLGCMATTIL